MSVAKPSAASSGGSSSKRVSSEADARLSASCASCKTSLMKAETLHNDGKMAPAINVLCEILCKDHESSAHRITVDVALNLVVKIFCNTLRRKGEAWLWAIVAVCMEISNCSVLVDLHRHGDEQMMDELIVSICVCFTDVETPLLALPPSHLRVLVHLLVEKTNWVKVIQLLLAYRTTATMRVRRCRSAGARTG